MEERNWKKAWQVEEVNGKFYAYDPLGHPYEFNSEDDAYQFLDDIHYQDIR